MTNEQRAALLVKLLNMFVRVKSVTVTETEYVFDARIDYDQTDFIVGLVMLANGMLPKDKEVVVSEKGFTIEDRQRPNG